MNRHPSSADLAAFRASIYRQSIRETGAPITDPAPMRPYRWTDGDPSRLAGHGLIARERTTHPPVSGAWEQERREGIGAADRDPIPCRKRHAGRIPCAVEAGDRYQRCRREAAAMRSRTFEAIAAAVPGDAGLALDFDAAMDTFEPR